jgi:hypothetical protein
MNTPRTHDDGRNEKQRAQAAREQEAEHERSRQRDQRSDPNDRQRFERENDPKERERLLDEKPFDFIERTRPEDPTGDRRQLTRDNVNPNIPSVEPEETGLPIARVKDPGGIVDPKSLGMESQAGAQPPKLVNQPEQWPKNDDATGQAKQPERSAEPAQQYTEAQIAAHMHSPNEPVGSTIGGEAGGGEPAPGEPLVLSDIDPDSVEVGSMLDFTLTVTGSGFTSDCVILFDDEELPTTLVNSTTLTANPPAQAEAGTVDVEVARGEDLSDVLTFEFVAPAGRRSSEKAERKPKKTEPRGKRQTKDKSKGRR